MEALRLWFAGDERAALFKTEFSHRALDRCRISIRGKVAGAHAAASTFQWSQGTQALSILILKAVASQRADVQQRTQSRARDRVDCALSLSGLLVERGHSLASRA